MIEGSFIVLEGIDGAGTTTQVTRLCDELRAHGLPALATREPTPGPVGSLLRLALSHRLVVPGVHGAHAPNWKTMALLFAADRLDHLETEIFPNLLDGVNVVCDRYDLSSLAYQSVTADQHADVAGAITWIRTLNQHARRPDLTVILDVSAEVAAQRRRERGQIAELYESADLQANLVDAYRNAEALLPGDRIVHVDGNRSAGEVAQAVAAAVHTLRTNADGS